MSFPVILLVEPDQGQARMLIHTLAEAALPLPVHMTTGEQAVVWASANPCAVCVLDYKLPGINGLETLVRLRQRQPDLPVIMVSNARAEDVAVAAFRAGVVDYIPKNRGYQTAVTQRVQQLVQTAPVATPLAPTMAPDLHPELLRPTYQNRLRVIGRQLDLYGYHSVSLLEVGGGFLVRALPAGERVPTALEFADRDFPQLAVAGFAGRGERQRQRATSPLLPTGYEDFLRALGHRLDSQLAEAVTVTELTQFVAVGCVAKIERHAQTAIEPLQTLLRKEDTALLLDEAYRRRARAGSRPPVFARLLGR